MKLTVFGLGHIGCVSSACFAQLGHDVIGFDINHAKVALINSGASPIFEYHLDEMIATEVQNGRLRATDQIDEAIAEAEIVLVCVDTPSNGNGSISFHDVLRVCQDIGTALRRRDGYPTITIRSTILPGFAQKEAIPLLERTSQKVCGRDFGFAVNPEFLREGTAIDDFFNPPRTLFAGVDETSRKRLHLLYEPINAPIFSVTVDEAMMVKYADNTFHAIKVAFANEIGRLCKSMDIDSRSVMHVFAQDRKLNLSPYYLRPGFAFGGSCLPKDLKAIVHQADENQVPIPLIRSVIPSNRDHIHYAYRMIQKTGIRKVGLLGLSFKGGTDDLRESPLIYLVEELLANGYEVRIFDRYITLAQNLESTKNYIDRELSHLSALMCDSPEDLLDQTQLIVIGNNTGEHRDLILNLNHGHQIIDMVDLVGKEQTKVKYEGICW
ncbi:MAG TPA: nucleotide sugar dehydrogenase [bacterium]|nr:nucleotide sugar dehydrogenase [bacterium]HNT64606.1 nucleotide sugar dehydrogenase [bacterium]HOX84551.1 nucleotide sugar dehydrogenase [bacterium]HPG45274.1 nucleotide sugar dehydrogenase [bacterium]HPM99007.1 nucleotide sugar dehydrogenase [bacterium]